MKVDLQKCCMNRDKIFTLPLERGWALLQGSTRDRSRTSSWTSVRMLPTQTWEKKAIYTEDKDGRLRNVIFSNACLVFLYWWLKFSNLVIVTHVHLFAGGCQVLSEPHRTLPACFCNKHTPADRSPTLTSYWHYQLKFLILKILKNKNARCF